VAKPVNETVGVCVAAIGNTNVPKVRAAFVVKSVDDCGIDIAGDHCR
jgi:hypothetical protein